jgi:hypothetical protein
MGRVHYLPHWSYQQRYTFFLFIFNVLPLCSICMTATRRFGGKRQTQDFPWHINGLKGKSAVRGLIGLRRLVKPEGKTGVKKPHVGDR